MLTQLFVAVNEWMTSGAMTGGIGMCPVGCIAPILAIVTVQKQVVTGVIYILLFAIGHCLPILIAGSSIALVQKMLENKTWQNAGVWFRRFAGSTIGLLGLYFILNPFLGSS